MKTIFLYNRSGRSHMIHSDDLISGHNPNRQRNPLDRKFDWIDAERTVQLPAHVAEKLMKMFPKDFKKVSEMDDEQKNDDIVKEELKEAEVKPKAKKAKGK